MLKTITSSLLLCSLIAFPGYAEEIYKRVDEKGVPSFSDTQSEGAEKIIVEPVNVQSIATPAAPPASSPIVSAGFQYSALDITSPEDQSTLRNEHKILLQATIAPGLRQGHQIEFLDNGQPIQAAGRTTSIELTNFDRGTHNLSARILDTKGKVLKTSPQVTVHIFRTQAN